MTTKSNQKYFIQIYNDNNNEYKCFCDVPKEKKISGENWEIFQFNTEKELDGYVKELNKDYPNVRYVTGESV